jgi:uncharacterized membrane protein
MGSGWEGLLFNPLFTALLSVLWTALIVAVVRSLSESGDDPAAPICAARRLLDDHLAKGEIGREEYVDRRKGLDHITAIA